MKLIETASVFLGRATASLGAAEGARVGAAWTLAERAHSGQRRQSGEPYVTHPLAVAELLLELLPPDADLLCAALLHDTVEDTEVSVEVLREQFGDSVADIVDGVSKLDQVKLPAASSAKEETLKKLIAAGGRDWRVFAVKLCDRLHNMRTLQSVGVEKRRRVATETEAVFLPLARYVGLRRVAIELETLCRQSLRPWRWRALARWTLYKRRVDERRIAPLLRDESLKQVVSRSTTDELRFNESVSRSFALLREDRSRRALFAAPRFVRPCASIGEAYQLLSVLHSSAIEVPGSFTTDSTEGWVSTKVLLGTTGPVAEFVFEYPVAALAPWIRSAGASLDGDDFAAVAAGSHEPGEFTRVLRELLLQKTIVTFTPKGRRLTLPRHSTGLDFAFAVHTDLGLRARSIRLNGVLKDIATELQSGDIVEVVTAEEVVARPEWESILRSPRSRAKLRQWLRDLRRRDVRALGRRLLDDAMRLAPAPGVVDSGLDEPALWSAFGVESGEALLGAIGGGQVSAFAVASKLAGSGAHAMLAVTSELDGRSRLVLDGSADGVVSYCKYCFPLPGDPVVAEVSAEQTVVHRLTCPVKGRGDRLAGEHVNLVWAERLARPVTSLLRLHCADRTGLLADCARVISDAGLNVVAVNTVSRRNQTSQMEAELAFTVLVSSRAKFDRCVEALRDVPQVLNVTRALLDLSS